MGGGGGGPYHGGGGGNTGHGTIYIYIYVYTYCTYQSEFYNIYIYIYIYTCTHKIDNMFFQICDNASPKPSPELNKVIRNCWHGGGSTKTSDCISHSFKEEWPDYKYNVLLATNFVMRATYVDQIVFEWYGYKINIWSTEECVENP